MFKQLKKLAALLRVRPTTPVVEITKPKKPAVKKAVKAKKLND